MFYPYHFIRVILSVSFCPYHFVLELILSILCTCTHPNTRKHIYIHTYIGTYSCEMPRSINITITPLTAVVLLRQLETTNHRTENQFRTYLIVILQFVQEKIAIKSFDLVLAVLHTADKQLLLQRTESCLSPKKVLNSQASRWLVEAFSFQRLRSFSSLMFIQSHLKPVPALRLRGKQGCTDPF